MATDDTLHPKSATAVTIEAHRVARATLPLSDRRDDDAPAT